MKRFVLFAAVLAMVSLLASLSLAQTRASATQQVTLGVNPIYRLVVAGNPTLTITDGTAGGGLTSVTEGTSTYSVTMNQTVQHLTVQLSAVLPSGVDLLINVPSNRGDTQGTVSIRDANAHAVVTDLSRGADNGQPITYTLTATTAADPLAPTAYTVTWTLAD